VSYSLKIVFGSDGLPIIDGSTGTLPPAGHVITVSGHYETPTLDGDRVNGRLTLNAQQFDGVGDHVISAYQYHDRSVQGQTMSDIKIVQRLVENRKAIEEAERGWKADPEAPLPEVGPGAHKDGEPVL
jgi:hypothetical protein